MSTRSPRNGSALGLEQPALTRRPWPASRRRARRDATERRGRRRPPSPPPRSGARRDRGRHRWSRSRREPSGPGAAPHGRGRSRAPLIARMPTRLRSRPAPPHPAGLGVGLRLGLLLRLEDRHGDHDRGHDQRGADPGMPGGSRWSARTPWRPQPRSGCRCADADRVARTARPSAPPTCAEVLTRPEARPASSLVAPDIARVISAGKREAGARAEQDHRRQEMLEVIAVHRGRVKRTSPHGYERHAGDQRRPGAKAHDQRLRVTDGEGAHDNRRRQERKADLQGGSSRAPAACTATRGRTSRTSRRPTAPGPALAPETFRERKIRSGISGLGARASRTTKATSSASETAPSPSARAEPQP